MPILKLTPSCKDYLWGGSRLRTDFGIKSDLDPLAEAWVLSSASVGFARRSSPGSGSAAVSWASWL